jgi:hypothetical protein
MCLHILQYLPFSTCPFPFFQLHLAYCWCSAPFYQLLLLFQYIVKAFLLEQDNVMERALALTFGDLDLNLGAINYHLSLGKALGCPRFIASSVKSGL